MGGKVTSARITVYLSPEEAKALGEWATSERRSVSNLAAAVLLDALEGRRAKSHANNKEGEA